MNDARYKARLRARLRPAFKGRRRIVSKTVQIYPATAEREYIRLVYAYTRYLRKLIDAELPSIMRAYRREMEPALRYDDELKFFEFVKKKFSGIAKKLEKFISGFNLREKLAGIADLVKKNLNREWKRTVKTTLKQDVDEEYYGDEFFSDIVNQWTADQEKTIKAEPARQLEEVENIVTESFKKGGTATETSGKIDDLFTADRKKAKNTARDQVSKLNSRMSRRQQEDAGVDRYMWKDSRDERVRPCHRSLHGKIFLYSDPPEMWYETNAGRIYTGRYCHPGEDYRCRCVAVPVFDIESIDLPPDVPDDDDVDPNEEQTP